jgi:hypothetical protein
MLPVNSLLALDLLASTTAVWSNSVILDKIAFLNNRDDLCQRTVATGMPQSLLPAVATLAAVSCAQQSQADVASHIKKGRALLTGVDALLTSIMHC